MPEAAKSWPEFYKGRVGGREGESYEEYFAERYRPFMDILRNAAFLFSTEIPVLHEVGCGTATASTLLVHKCGSPQVVASDISVEMLGLAQSRLSAKNISATLLRADCRMSPIWQPARLAYSHGLLEHLSDEDIRETIAAHRYADAQVHYVPGIMHGSPSFGDERLLTVHQWQEICNPTEVLVFNGGKDYALVFKKEG